MLLFCPLPALSLNVGITAVVSCCPRSRGCSLNNPGKLTGKHKSGLWLVETVRFLEGVRRRAIFRSEGRSYLWATEAFFPDLKPLRDHGVLLPCSLAPVVYLHARQPCYISQLLARAACSTLQHNMEDACSAGSEALSLCRPLSMRESKCAGRGKGIPHPTSSLSVRK